MRPWFWKLVGLALAFGALAFAEEPTHRSHANLDFPEPASSVRRENAIRIHGGALLSTKNDQLQFGPSVGFEVLRHTRSSGVAIGMEISAIQTGGKGGLFEGMFDSLAGPEWSGHRTSAIFVLPTLTLRPTTGALRPYLALGVGPALFRQEATSSRTNQTREADAFRLIAMARAGIDFAFFDRFSLVVEPVQAGRVAGEWVYGSRLSVGVNF